MLQIVSVDVGITHFGFCVSYVNSETYELDRISDIELVDLTELGHQTVPKAKCSLYHTRTPCDWLHHLYQDFDCFHTSDIILVERQPLQGIQSIEQLLMHQWRDKVQIIPPQKMHSYFGINRLDYEGRKEKTTEITSSLLPDRLQEKFLALERKHDVSDSICILVYWLASKQEERKKTLGRLLYKHQSLEIKRQLGRLSVNESEEHDKQQKLNAWFDAFRYPNPDGSPDDTCDQTT